MVFSSISFLFLFFPIVLIVHYIFGRKSWNSILLIASLVFYAWGESKYVLIMLYSVFVSYVIGILINIVRFEKYRTKILAIGIIFNLIPLVYFKYLGFITTNINVLFNVLGLKELDEVTITLPIGISFFTFQAISYLIDIFKRQAEPQTSIFNLGLYISLFPQLIAGPIVRYSDINKQIRNRKIDFSDIGIGVQRFIIGLSKKVLIANTMGELADSIFSLDPNNLNAGIAWLGIAAYTLQIYYDFSGYSDMAIGLCRIFGFRINENFNYPYSALCIKDFWRRWHISLSSWFRDYLYIPLGGNQKGRLRTMINLFIIFLLCGLWHGAQWTFIVWGIFHGCLLAFERFRFFDATIGKLPKIFQKLYALLLIMLGWVLFRSPTLDFAVDYYLALLDFTRPIYLDVYLVNKLNNEFYLLFVVGIIFSQPVYPLFKKKHSFVTRFLDRYALNKIENHLKAYITSIVLSLLFVLSIISTISGDYNPFLYFQF